MMANKHVKGCNMATSSSDEGVGRNNKETSSTDELQRCQKRMFENIASSGARISSQQKDEEDLTLEQKVEILQEIFEKKPSIFVERFYMYLTEEDFVVFENYKSIYEVEFYLTEAKKRLSPKNYNIVKNRRYEALQRLEKEGIYFGEDAMQERAPFMYDYYVGQYLSEEEKKEKPYDTNTEMKFSTVLIDFMHRKDREALFKKQQEEEECMKSESEEDTEDEEDQEDEYEEEQGNDRAHSSHQKASMLQESITDEEKHMLRQEFISRMRERFLSGEDEDFDYTSVDFNSEYDSVEMRTWDEQEKYFDDD